MRDKSQWWNTNCKSSRWTMWVLGCFKWDSCVLHQHFWIVPQCEQREVNMQMMLCSPGSQWGQLCPWPLQCSWTSAKAQDPWDLNFWWYKGTAKIRQCEWMNQQIILRDALRCDPRPVKCVCWGFPLVGLFAEIGHDLIIWRCNYTNEISLPLGLILLWPLTTLCLICNLENSLTLISLTHSTYCHGICFGEKILPKW